MMLSKRTKGARRRLHITGRAWRIDLPAPVAIRRKQKQRSGQFMIWIITVEEAVRNTAPANTALARWHTKS
jgi:hypothetical protein